MRIHEIARPVGIDGDLRALKATLPRGSKFKWQNRGDTLYLEILRLPVMGKGAGTNFFARVLAVADQHSIPTVLHADPSDEPGEPSTYDLVRWYSRFGYTWVGLNDQEWCEMRREPRPWRGGPDAILADYAAAKANGDMTHKEFTERLHSYLGV